MEFFNRLITELKSLAEIFITSRQKELKSDDINSSISIKFEAEWAKAMDNVPENNLSPRVLLPQVQDSIKHFNELSSDEKSNILELADQKLQDKLMVFMEYNSKFSDNVELTANILRGLLVCAKSIQTRGFYTEKELAVMLKEFQRFVAKANIEADRLMNAFISYRSGCDDGVKISSDNKDEHAIGHGILFKQKINNYRNEVNLKLKNLLKDSLEHKHNFMNDILDILNDLQIELDCFQSLSIELMNGFIPEAVNEENRFYSKAKCYAEEGIPTNLYIENKVVENILIDALLESANMKVATAA